MERKKTKTVTEFQTRNIDERDRINAIRRAVAKPTVGLDYCNYQELVRIIGWIQTVEQRLECLSQQLRRLETRLNNNGPTFDIGFG